MIRELLTTLSKKSKSLDDWFDNLGLFGTFLGFLTTLAIWGGMAIFPIWIMNLLFPSFVKFGDKDILLSIYGLLYLAIFGIIWLFIAKPKDYVASKISDDIYKIITDLNKTLKEAASLGINIEIKEELDQNCQCFKVNFYETSTLETEKVADCKIQVLQLVKRLNTKLKKAEDRDIEVSTDLNYWGPEQMKKESESYKYLFSANIVANNKDSAT